MGGKNNQPKEVIFESLLLYKTKSNTYIDYKNILQNDQIITSISSGSEILDVWEDLIAEDLGTIKCPYKEENKMLVVYDWKCPRTDAKKVTCIVPLPSGVVPETVKFNFERKSQFQSQAFSLTYEWPEKLLMPEVIFKVDMRSDRSFDVKNEFVEFREVIMKLGVYGDSPKSKITVKLPFPVQRSHNSFQTDLRRFGTSHSAILSRGAEKERFTSMRDMAQSVRNSDHKVYVMLVRLTGVEVEGERRIEKTTRCVQDCDDSSLSSVEDGENKNRYDDHINTEVYMNSMSQSVFENQRKKQKRKRT